MEDWFELLVQDLFTRVSISIGYEETEEDWRFSLGGRDRAIRRTARDLMDEIGELKPNLSKKETSLRISGTVSQETIGAANLIGISPMASRSQLGDRRSPALRRIASSGSRISFADESTPVKRVASRLSLTIDEAILGVEQKTINLPAKSPGKLVQRKLENLLSIDLTSQSVEKSNVDEEVLILLASGRS